MPWFNVDDGFYDHPKVDDLPLEAVGLWTLAGAYCMRQLTDGAITESRVRKFGGTPAAVDPPPGGAGPDTAGRADASNGRD